MKKLSVVASVLISLIANSAFATGTVTIESKVVSPLQASEKTVTIVGPDSTQYRVVGPQPEIERIISISKAQPETVISFNGVVAEENGAKVFRFNNWKKIEKSTTTTSSDGLGTHRTETRTETQQQIP